MHHFFEKEMDRDVVALQLRRLRKAPRETFTRAQVRRWLDGEGPLDAPDAEEIAG